MVVRGWLACGDMPFYPADIRRDLRQLDLQAHKVRAQGNKHGRYFYQVVKHELYAAIILR